MTEYNELFDLLFSNIRKLLNPEEWIALDFAFSKTEIFTLLIVERHGEIMMSQLADYISIPMSTATGIIDRLVRNGYLKRERGESDRRIVVIKLSDEGRSVVDGIKGSVMQYITLINENLTDEERKLLYGIFLKIAGMLGNNKRDKGLGDKEKSSIQKIGIE